jgi:hypothetical protein
MQVATGTGAGGGLRSGGLVVANQIKTGNGIDGRPHDLVLVAAFDTSSGHTYGDYDIRFEREKVGSNTGTGVAIFNSPIKWLQDLAFQDASNNVLMTLTAATQQLLMAATSLGARIAQRINPSQLGL